MIDWFKNDYGLKSEAFLIIKLCVMTTKLFPDLEVVLRFSY